MYSFLVNVIGSSDTD